MHFKTDNLLLGCSRTDRLLETIRPSNKQSRDTKRRKGLIRVERSQSGCRTSWRFSRMETDPLHWWRPRLSDVFPYLTGVSQALWARPPPRASGTHQPSQPNVKENSINPTRKTSSNEAELTAANWKSNPPIPLRIGHHFKKNTYFR